MNFSHNLNKIPEEVVRREEAKIELPVPWPKSGGSDRRLHIEDSDWSKSREGGGNLKGEIRAGGQGKIKWLDWRIKILKWENKYIMYLFPWFDAVK